jgi:hypothetical protein
VASAQRKPDLRDRWHRAESLTDDRIGEVLTSALTADELIELERRLLAFVQVPASVRG